MKFLRDKLRKWLGVEAIEGDVDEMLGGHIAGSCVRKRDPGDFSYLISRLVEFNHKHGEDLLRLLICKPELMGLLEKYDHLPNYEQNERLFGELCEKQSELASMCAALSTYRKRNAPKKKPARKKGPARGKRT